MKMKNTLRFLVLTLLAWLGTAGTALAQNAIESFDVTQQGGNIVVRITTKEPLKGVPANFSVANPARLAFDFPNTANALGATRRKSARASCAA
jgi:type IV pilus assembly protein PilQ